MKKLLIATSNPGKLTELTRFLADVPVELVGLKDVGITDLVVESGQTFAENAIIKAKYYFQKSGLPTLADDGGFEIDALGGEPGVKSHRWIHQDREDTDEELVAYTIERLKDVPIEKRGAQLRLVLALVIFENEVHTQEASVRGVIPLKPANKITPGYPYRSILFLPEINKFYNYEELTHEETEKYNHRKRALEELKPLIRRYLTS